MMKVPREENVLKSFSHIILERSFSLSIRK